MKNMKRIAALGLSAVLAATALADAEALLPHLQALTALHPQAIQQRQIPALLPATR